MHEVLSVMESGTLHRALRVCAETTGYTTSDNDSKYASMSHGALTASDVVTPAASPVATCTYRPTGLGSCSWSRLVQSFTWILSAGTADKLFPRKIVKRTDLLTVRCVSRIL